MSNFDVKDAALNSDVIVDDVDSSVCPMLMSCCCVIACFVCEHGVHDDGHDDDGDDYVSSAAGAARCAPACCRCSGDLKLLDDDVRWLLISAMMSWE